MKPSRHARTGVVWLTVHAMLAPVSHAVPWQETTLSIEVFTDAQHPVDAYGHARVQVYPVDATSRFVTRMNSSLAHEKGQTEAVARTAWRRGQRHAGALAACLEGLRRARRYGVERVPAMVFDARAIVYGMTDIGQALAIYQHWRRSARQP